MTNRNRNLQTYRAPLENGP